MGGLYCGGGHQGGIRGCPPSAVMMGKAAAFSSNGQLCVDATVITNYSMSLVAWFRTTTSGSAQHMFGISDGAPSGLGSVEFYLNLTSGGVPQFTRRNGGTVGTATESLDSTDGNWHMVTGVGNSISAADLYLDGRTVSQDATSVNPTDFDRVCLGLNGNFVPSEPYTGDLDQVILFNDALTGAEHTWLYNSGAGRTYNDIVTSGDANNPGTTNMVAFWPLNEDRTNGIGHDDHTNNHHLSLIGGTVTSTGGVVDDS